MKTVLVTLTLLLSVSSFATSGKTAPRNNGSGVEQCAWYDAGKYEEHSPHLTQQECVASGHGSCSERCFVYVQVCSAEGVRIEIGKDAQGNPVRKEVTQSFSGRDRDYRFAEEQAMRSCQNSWSPRYDFCRPKGCHEEADRTR